MKKQSGLLSGHIIITVRYDEHLFRQRKRVFLFWWLSLTSSSSPKLDFKRILSHVSIIVYQKSGEVVSRHVRDEKGPSLSTWANEVHGGRREERSSGKRRRVKSRRKGYWWPGERENERRVCEIETERGWGLSKSKWTSVYLLVGLIR